MEKTELHLLAIEKRYQQTIEKVTEQSAELRETMTQLEERRTLLRQEKNESEMRCEVLLKQRLVTEIELRGRQMISAEWKTKLKMEKAKGQALRTRLATRLKERRSQIDRFKKQLETSFQGMLLKTAATGAQASRHAMPPAPQQQKQKWSGRRKRNSQPTREQKAKQSKRDHKVKPSKGIAKTRNQPLGASKDMKGSSRSLIVHPQEHCQQTVHSKVQEPITMPGMSNQLHSECNSDVVTQAEKPATEAKQRLQLAKSKCVVGKDPERKVLVKKRSDIPNTSQRPVVPIKLICALKPQRKKISKKQGLVSRAKPAKKGLNSVKQAPWDTKGSTVRLSSQHEEEKQCLGQFDEECADFDILKAFAAI